MAAKKSAKKKAAKKPARKVAKKTAKKPAVRPVKNAAKPVTAASRMAAKQVAVSAAHHGGIQHYAWRREHYKTLHEFWPFYLHEHSVATNRLLHFIGSSLGIIIFAVAMGLGNFVLIIPALVSGYAFAWFGHFFIEKNRPATFKYPLKSFISDWRMWYTMLTGRIAQEMRKYGIQSR